MKRTWHRDTLAIHAGQSSEATTGAQAVPVYRTAAFEFRSSQHAADLFALKELGNIYSRLTNPTNDVLEQRMAAIEGGAGALALASGTAAIYFSITNILRTGDELVSTNNLYGGTFTMFDAILPQQGIQVRLTDVNDFKAVEEAITEKTRAIYLEMLDNPTLEVADIDRYAEIAERHRLPLLVDATFTPPCLFRPLEHGATVSIHSLSKWIGGHGTGIGGIVTDSGRFDWTDPKFSLYNEPDRGYHDLRFAHDLGALNRLAFIMRLRTVGLRNQGPTLAPDVAWLFLQGLESLPVRMERHCKNALHVAQFLSRHPQVAWVRYPGLEQDPSYKLAQRYFPDGCGGMVVFGLRGGSRAGRQLVDSIELFTHVANVGDAKSLIVHPASTTHSQLSESDQRAAGIRPELIRLSIGLEHIDDLCGALGDALDRLE